MSDDNDTPVLDSNVTDENIDDVINASISDVPVLILGDIGDESESDENIEPVDDEQVDDENINETIDNEPIDDTNDDVIDDEPKDSDNNDVVDNEPVDDEQVDDENTYIMDKWSVEEVKDYISNLGTSNFWKNYGLIMAENYIDGTTLVSLSISDLEEIGIKKIHAKRIMKDVNFHNNSKYNLVCKIHNEPIKLVSKDDEQFICIICLATSHFGKKGIEIEDYIKDKQKNLNKVNNELEQVRNNIKESYSDIERNLTSSSEYFLSLEQEIKTFEEKASNIIKLITKQCLEESSKLYNIDVLREKLSHYNTSIKQIELTIERITSLSDVNYNDFLSEYFDLSDDINSLLNTPIDNFKNPNYLPSRTSYFDKILDFLSKRLENTSIEFLSKDPIAFSFNWSKHSNNSSINSKVFTGTGSCSIHKWAKGDKPLPRNQYFEITWTGTPCYGAIGVATSKYNPDSTRLGMDSYSWGLRIYGSHSSEQFIGAWHAGIKTTVPSISIKRAKIIYTIDGELEFYSNNDILFCTFKNIPEEELYPIGFVCGAEKMTICEI